MTKFLSIQRAIAKHHGFVVWNPFGDSGVAQQLHFYYFLDGEKCVVDHWGKHRIRMLYDVDRRLAKIFYDYDNETEAFDEMERSTLNEF